MSSINHKNSAKVNTFFFEELVPLAKKLHNKNDSIFFPKKPDLLKDTYFVDRKKVTMTSEDFECGGCSSPDDLKRALIRLWIAEGYTELPTIIDSIVKLAELACHTEEQGSEVSPFIYVMF